MVDPVSNGTVNLGSIYGAKAQSFAKEVELLVAEAKIVLRNIGVDSTDLKIKVLKYPNDYPYIELSGRKIYHRDLDKIRQKFWKEFQMAVVML